MSNRNAERGFTLIEIVVAFIIASLALVALMRGGGSGVGAVVTAGHYEEALSRAQSHLAALGHSVTIEPEALEGDDGDGYHWWLTLTRSATSTPRKPAPGQPEQPGVPVSLYRVEVAVGWRDGGRTRRVTLETQRLGPGAKAAP